LWGFSTISYSAALLRCYPIAPQQPQENSVRQRQRSQRHLELMPLRHDRTHEGSNHNAVDTECSVPDPSLDWGELEHQCG
jgi:hypothetical protein